ncbi:MAG: hypothetical protein ACK55I_02150 [bacterium]
MGERRQAQGAQQQESCYGFASAAGIGRRVNPTRACQRPDHIQMYIQKTQ